MKKIQINGQEIFVPSGKTRSERLDYAAERIWREVLLRDNGSKSEREIVAMIRGILKDEI